MAKTRQFKLRGFLRQVDDSLLLEYMKAVGTPITIKNEYKNPDEKRLDIENQYAKISEEKRQEIEMDLLDVEELGCDSGIETILSIADKQRSKIADEITLLENNINQSFYCFLNERELFNDAIALYGVKEQSNKKVRTGLKQISFDDIKGKKTILEERLSALIMLKDGRGRHCLVDEYQFPDRMCFIAHPEDYLKSDQNYDKDGTLRRVTRRPSFMITYMYYPEGKLELIARCGNERLLELFTLFNMYVLDDDKPIKEFQNVYELERLFESSFVFSEDPADEVEEVYLKGITLIAKYSGKERITIAVETAIGVETIKDKLKKLHINLSDYNVNQAVIYLKFKGEGRKGSVTMRLSYPDRDNLNDSHYHQKAKVYVNKWGLLNESRGA